MRPFFLPVRHERRYLVLKTCKRSYRTVFRVKHLRNELQYRRSIFSTFITVPTFRAEQKQKEWKKLQRSYLIAHKKISNQRSSWPEPVRGWTDKK